jgi:rhamnulokinase
MPTVASFLGVDLGASSGRVMAGHWNEGQLRLEELHRFPNAGVRVVDHIYWDVLNIWQGVLDGLRQYGTLHRTSPIAVGVDGWGIDFGLLDSRGCLISNPVHYRDARTEGIPERLFQLVDQTAIFDETGVQSWRINTLFQLFSMVLEDDPALKLARSLLTIPDLFSYFLCGSVSVEFTEATTTQMFAVRSLDWAKDLLRVTGIPDQIMPPVVSPGSHLGTVRPAVMEETGFSQKFPVVAVAAHDTASAVAAIPHLDETSMFISCGTWSLVGAELAAPNLSREARRLGFTNEGSVNGKFLLLRNLAGLWIIQECMRCWKIEGNCLNWEQLLESARISPAFRSLLDPNDPSFDLPLDMPTAVAQYCVSRGQSAPNDPGECARAIFEGLALSYRAVLRSLEHITGRPIVTIRIVGGGSQNWLLCQMTADACNRIVVAGPKEATVLGNVLAQAIATGYIRDFQEARSVVEGSFRSKTYEPQTSDQWDEAFANFQRRGRRGEADSPAGISLKAQAPT